MTWDWSWWQICLTTWLVGWLLVFLFAHWTARSEPTSHGQGILAMMGCLGFLWPVYLAWLPFAGIIFLIEWIKAGRNPWGQ